MIAAVVPMKRLSAAKQRLAGVLGPEERGRLCLWMLGRMLEAFSACPEVGETLVVTPDGAVRDHVKGRFPQARVLFDPLDLPLNGAARLAAAEVAGRGYGRMLFALGDLPFLTAGEVSRMAGLRTPAVLAPDRRGQGTNALLLTPPGALEPAFGAGSFQRHLQEAGAAGLACEVFESPGFGCDIDTPDDLQYARDAFPGEPFPF